MARLGQFVFPFLATGTIFFAFAAPADAKMTKAQKAALDEAVHGCKAEAKGKKIGWIAGRKYVNNCVAARLKDRPDMNVGSLLKDHPAMKKEEWDAF
jgi:hypothetical protein